MIRWITERLGTAPATGHEFPEGAIVVDVRDLVDKHGNDPAVVRRALDRAADAMRRGATVVVCCDYGISRSNAVAAGVIALANATDLDDAVMLVTRATGEGDIKLGPLEAVRRALGAGTAAVSADSSILLTGGSGFLGQALTKELGSASVIRPARCEVDLTGGALRLDLLARRHRVSRIVHLANPRVYTSTRAVGDMVVMLRNVLEVCGSLGIPLVYLSGWEVYSGYRTTALIADESLPFRPKGPSGEAKVLCEKLIELHRSHHGTMVTILRPAPIYGHGSERPKFIFNMLDKARRGDTIRTHRYRNGLPALDLLHRDDAVRAIASVARFGGPPSANLGGGELISTRQVAERIIERTRSTSNIEFVDIDDDIANVRMDNGVAERELGWVPRVAVRDGLDALIGEATS